MNNRERFLRTLEFRQANPPWVRWGLYLWDETITRWRREGWDGTPLNEIFGVGQLVRVDPYYGDVLWTFEMQAGLDVLQVRRQFGRDLALWGGINKRALAEDGETMRREVDRVMPLVEEGGYIPEPDHGIPPDVSWSNFCEYVTYLKFRLGRE